ncbi:hypothetical protein NKJ06_05770 [Mesorhizobium sp. M0293]|uniref:hypothetical protein n=1 Tax=unclassified Mesorhizobium TaxID=325217 RepID=UPI00333A6BA5
MVQSRREKLDKQRERQRAVRIARKTERKPSRDDIARALLHYAIVQNLKLGRGRELDRLQASIVEELAVQGFDRKAADAAFDDLVDKYGSGWTFQRKRHLRGDSKIDEAGG